MNRKKYAFAAMLCAAALNVACGIHEPAVGPMQTRTIRLDGGGATHANIELDLGAGQLNVQGGAQGLLDGKFEYNVDAYEPKIENTVNGSHAVVTIRQAGSHSFGNHGRNTWDLKLSDKVLIDLAVNCGAGQAEMQLGEVALRALNVHMGAGQVNLDLRGSPRHDYDVDIAGGVGQATVYLPAAVGIRAEAHGGLGNVSVTGLRKAGDHYQNDLYDSAKVNVRLKVEGGIGEIKIIG